MDNVTAAPKPDMTERIWGRMNSVELSVRIVSLVFVAVSILAIIFCQLGFWYLGPVGTGMVYLILVIAPLMMGAYLFGPYMSGILGLYTGSLLFLHASQFPLDYYEVYFMNPGSTFVHMPIIGICSGVLFNLALRGDPKGSSRFVRIGLVCLAVSVLASILLVGNLIISYGGIEKLARTVEYLSITWVVVVIQAAVDAVISTGFCIVVDILLRKVVNHAANRRIVSLFNNWLLMVTSIVFMLVSALLFTLITHHAVDQSQTRIASEITYLRNQLVANKVIDLQVLVGGYEKDVDGIVAIVNGDGIILASDDDTKFAPGRPLLEALGMSAFYEEFTLDTFMDSSQDTTESVSIVQDTDDDGELILDFAYLGIGKYQRGFIVMFVPAHIVYRTRSMTMLMLTVLAILLIATVFVLASFLLREVVGRRIFQTNKALAKITAGNLDERVGVHGTVEFNSLSDGINQTVDALEEMIREVERRNEKDLSVAKNIQESNLPHDFPPFPDISAFSIYASMSAAREVGGDFYDFFEIDDEHIGFLIADVSGKGIPGALFMMEAKNEIEHRMESGRELADAIRMANQRLCANNEAGMFVTVWAAVLNWCTGEVTYVNAGHNFPLLRHGRGGMWEWLKKKCGLFLGTFETAKYRQETLTLEPGDELVLYTDGVNEAFNVAEEEYGNDRLEAFLDAHSSLPPEELVPALRGDVATWALGAEQSDDVTILALEYYGN